MDDACIVGVGETNYCRKPGSGKSTLALRLEAALAAIEDWGLAPSDIDGIMPQAHLANAEELAAISGPDRSPSLAVKKQSAPPSCRAASRYDSTRSRGARPCLEH